jgi:hypothetical protein
MAFAFASLIASSTMSIPATLHPLQQMNASGCSRYFYVGLALNRIVQAQEALIMQVLKKSTPT